MSYDASSRTPSSRDVLRLPVALGAVIAVAVIGLALVPDDDLAANPTPIASAVPSPAATTSVASTPPAATPFATTAPADALEPSNPRGPSRDPAAPRAPAPSTAWIALDPGAHELPWSHAQVRLTVPAGWSASADRTTLERQPGAGASVTVSIHEVARIETDVCRRTDALQEVGPTADDLATALSRQTGISSSGPTDMTVGGFPAQRFVLALPAGCPGFQGRWLWENVSGRRFGLLAGGTATVYIVDVMGRRLVIASHSWRAEPAAAGELDDVVASIDISTACRPLSPRVPWCSSAGSWPATSAGWPG